LPISRCKYRISDPEDFATIRILVYRGVKFANSSCLDDQSLICQCLQSRLYCKLPHIYAITFVGTTVIWISEYVANCARVLAVRAKMASDLPQCKEKLIGTWTRISWDLDLLLRALAICSLRVKLESELWQNPLDLDLRHLDQLIPGSNMVGDVIVKFIYNMSISKSYILSFSSKNKY
jgi:hypothetical protein